MPSSSLLCFNRFLGVKRRMPLVRSRLSTTPIRLKTTMGSRVPRSPVCADSRRPTEKLSFQTFMVEEPYSARPNTANLGKYCPQCSFV